MLRRADKASERLERALEGGPIPHDTDTRRALAAAGALAPGHSRSPERIQRTHDVMMAAFMRTLNPLETRDDAGTDDGLDDIELHRTEISLPDGGQLVVSDIEEITPERLEETAAAMAKILERRAKDHQS
ncbi:hypothetical protein QJ054_33770 [Streptomyces sp. AN-3]|uniref:hypothetical protein n=1 Tax=Streptomyces sp. AN-3 TaxID=3044177 RepID=UPI00249CEE37|nr:hypothetical protein [Streptomyces sp. AN-3]MDI3102006.1 hypothetical protein [Streptomyces sp. AN-3]MDV6291234.1 hypothetical protein [Streptomyces sp. UP1A-1]